MDFFAGFKITADSTHFERGMARALNTANDVGKKMASAFDGRAIGRTLATALGLSLTDIADKVARFWLDFSKDQEAALERTVEATERAAREQEKALERLRAAKAKEHQENLDRINEEWVTLRKAEEVGRKMIEERAEANRKAADEANAVVFKQWEAAEADKVAADEKVKTVRLMERQSELAAEVADKERKIAEANKEVVMLKTEINRIGKDDTNLSDRELAAKQRNLQQQAFQASLNIGGVYTGANTNDILGGVRSQELSRVMAEQNMRRNVRGLVGAFGEERAFEMAGLSEQRFRDIISGTTETQQLARRTAEGIEELNNRLRSGIPVVNLNGV